MIKKIPKLVLPAVILIGLVLGYYVLVRTVNWHQLQPAVPSSLIAPTFKPKLAVSPQPQVINGFDDCVQAGYPALESYPEKCRTPSGAIFVNPRQKAKDK